MDPIKIYYTSNEVGSNLTELLAVTARTNPAFDVSKFELALLSEENPPGAYSIVVVGEGESFSLTTELIDQGVVVVKLSQDSSLAKILQEALSLWLRRPVSEVIGVQIFENGRLAIYV